MITSNQGYLENHLERIADMAYSLSQRREHLPFRAFSIAGVEFPDAVSSITRSPANTPLIAMVFSGQGAQWATMGKELIDTDPDFKKDISAMDSILQGLLHPPDWKIESKTWLLMLFGFQQITDLLQLNSFEMEKPVNCTELKWHSHSARQSRSLYSTL